MQMIRIHTVFSLLNKIPLTDRQWLKKDSAGFRGAMERCPHCGTKGCLKEFGHYGRYLIELEAGKARVHPVEIKRYRCTSCRHTHALLSSCLVPYRSYSLRFMLTVLYSYFGKQKTVEQISADFGIAASTLYEWKKLFLRQKDVWLGVLKSLYRSETSFLKGLTGKEVSGFYERFRFSFLERMPCTDREASFNGSRKKRGIT